MLLVQPVDLWEFPMEKAVNTSQLLYLSPVSSVIAFCACMSTSKGITDQGERGLMVTSYFEKAAGEAFAS